MYKDIGVAGMCDEGFGNWLVSNHKFPRKMKKDLKIYGRLCRDALLMALSWRFRKDRTARRILNYVKFNKYNRR